MPTVLDFNRLRKTVLPEWTKPENASVFDPAYRAPVRTLIKWLGLDDPQQVMAFGTPLETGPMGGGALEAIGQRFPRFAEALKVYRGESKLGGLSSNKEPAKFFSISKDEAQSFANFAGEQGRVSRYYVDPKEFHRVSYIEASGGDSLYEPEVMQRIISDAKSGGYKGVIIDDIVNFEGGRPSTTVAVFDPSAVSDTRPEQIDK